MNHLLHARRNVVVSRVWGQFFIRGVYGSANAASSALAVNSSKPRKKMTTSRLLAKYRRNTKITMVTAYDYPSAQICDESFMDMILVGDSVGMVVMGQEDTVSVTMTDMVHHCQAVKRGSKFSFLVGDLPFGSYNTVDLALFNATRLLKEGGMDAVKLEGGTRVVPQIRALTDAGISVIGHIGLTPQSYRSLGGFTVQGKKPLQAQQLLQDAQDLVDAGVTAIVLEMLPSSLSKEITDTIPVPTIGIGAGPDTSGQVLVYHDILGLFDKFQPKFSKQYANLRADMVKALESYRSEVAHGKFPLPQHSFEVKSTEKIKETNEENFPSDSDFKRHIVVVGGGAVGSFFAGKLSGVSTNKVTVVSKWTEHIDAINQLGLQVHDDDSSEKVVIRKGNIAAVSASDVMSDNALHNSADVVYILVKSRGTKAAAEAALKLVKPGGSVITIQNGIGFEDIVREVFTKAKSNAYLTFGITSYGALIAGPGALKSAGTGVTTLFLPSESIVHHDVVADLQNAKMEVTVQHDSEAAKLQVWRKLSINAVVNPLAALFGVANGELLSHAPYSRVVNALTHEVALVAGVRTGWSATDLFSEVQQVLQLTAHNQNSMLSDVKRDQMTEFESICGEILKLARQNGTMAPLTNALSVLFRVLENGEGNESSDTSSQAIENVESSSVPSSVAVFNNIGDLRQFRKSISPSETVGFVPTMGALHSGHLSLVKAAKEECDRVVVSIFVNPTQFAPHEDFDSYPSSLVNDVALLASHFPDVTVFAPTSSEMYPRFKLSSCNQRDNGQTVFVVPDKIEKVSAEGKSRPNFFTGVATVCTKLFNIVQPHIAFFGQKDATQVIAIRQIVEELNMPLQVKVVDTAREKDGVAMSSRNVYLSSEDRAVAPIVYKALSKVHKEFGEKGERRVRALKQNVLSELLSNPKVSVDYVSVADGQTSEELRDEDLCSDSTMLSVAVTIGGTRLIDNIVLRQ